MAVLPEARAVARRVGVMDIHSQGRAHSESRPILRANKLNGNAYAETREERIQERKYSGNFQKSS